MMLTLEIADTGEQNMNEIQVARCNTQGSRILRWRLKTIGWELEKRRGFHNLSHLGFLLLPCIGKSGKIFHWEKSRLFHSHAVPII